MKSILQTLLILVYTILNNISIGQNLVPNPSFEDMTSCPNNECQIYKADGWFPVGFTPDYYNSCNTGLWSVPNNIAGFQNAATGVAYAGLASLNGPFWCRDYIGIELTEPLKAASRYYVRFKVSLADKSVFAINHIGAWFSMSSYEIYPYSCTSFDTLFPNNSPQIFTNDIITDTINWVEIKGSFTALEAYEYINIGNFFDNLNTQIITANSSGSWQAAYYYIDDVYVGTDSAESTSEYNINDFEVFPNPCKEELYVRIGNQQPPFFINLFNNMGQLLQTFCCRSNVTVIDMKEYAGGLYYLKAASVDTRPVKIIILP